MAKNIFDKSFSLLFDNEELSVCNSNKSEIFTNYFIITINMSCTVCRALTEFYVRIPNII